MSCVSALCDTMYVSSYRLQVSHVTALCDAMQEAADCECSVGNGYVRTVLSKRSRTVGTVQTLQCERPISSCRPQVYQATAL